MISKNKNKQKSNLNNKSELKLIFIDREKTTPCNICRKRVSCVIRPKEGKCNGLEEGKPWIMPSNEFEY